jgi:aminotransferase
VGTKRLRDALVAKQERFTGLRFDADREVVVCCGATECMASVMLALVDPGDEVIVFEPYYENYGPDAILCGATPRFVKLRAPDWSYDPAELEAAFTDRTRLIVVNTPNNPTGKVFTRARDGAHRRAVPEVGRHRGHRRDLRAHPVRRRRARDDGLARGDA